MFGLRVRPPGSTSSSSTSSWSSTSSGSGLLLDEVVALDELRLCKKHIDVIVSGETIF